MPSVTYDYDPGDYPPFAVTVDIAIFTIRDDALQVLLIERGKEPFLGALALPGGFVQPDEDLVQAAARELAEETGLRAGSWHLEQLGSYGVPGRDPRMRVVTVAYWAICAELPGLRGGGDAVRTTLTPVQEIERGSVRLAFDHERIVREAVERARSKLEYTTLAAKFCPPEFTISQLRRVYETVWNTDLDPGNFQRSVQDSGAFEKRVEAAYAPWSPRGRPASLWSVSESTVPSDRSAEPLARPLAKRGRAARSMADTPSTAAPARKEAASPAETDPTRRRAPTVAERRRVLQEYLADNGYDAVFGRVHADLCQPLREQGVWEQPGSMGIGFQLTEPDDPKVWKTYFGVQAGYLGSGIYSVSILPQAIHWGGEEALGQLRESVGVRDWPHGGYALSFRSSEEWEQLRPGVLGFVDAVMASRSGREGVNGNGERARETHESATRPD